MPTNRNTWNRSSTRRTTASYGGFGSLGGTRRTTGLTSWYNPNRTTRSSISTPSYSPNQFSGARETITAKIGSYRTINQQCSGAGKVTAFSPANCTKWINLVDDGCFVYKFTTNEFCRFFGSQFSASTPTQAMRTLRNRFGVGIKAVTRGKGNCWLVAATDRVSRRPFSTYNWK